MIVSNVVPDEREGAITNLLSLWRITFPILSILIMLSLTVNTPKSLFLSTPFLPNHHHHHHHHHHPPSPLNPHKSPKPLSISSLILPGSSSSSSSSSWKQLQQQQQQPGLILPGSSSSGRRQQQQQQVYQPFRPPPSPLPPKFRSLDTVEQLDVLSNRLGQWYEYAPLITSLISEGFTSSTLEEITGIASIEQNLLVVATQVRDSLVEATDDETVSYFDAPSSPEILYEIRILNTPQRALAAKFIIAYGFDRKRAEDLARSMKDYPRRHAEKGWESFDGNLPGDCLAFMYYRQAQEHKSASVLELSKIALERALEVVETERGKNLIMDDMEGKEGEGTGEGSVDVDDLVKVPVVRLAYGEVAHSSVVVVFPVCRAEAKEVDVVEAPWECGMGGQFGVVQAEKGWSRWVVLPGWGPVVGLKKGGVVVAFPKARGALPWRSKRRDADEEILVVVDREEKEVAFDDGFYLVVGGGNGSGEEGLKVERGVRLKENGVEESLGTVVLVVRPPRDEDDQLTDEEWD